MLAPWPTPDPGREDAEAEAALAGLQELVTQVRSLRKEYGVPEGEPVAVRLRGAPDRMRSTLAQRGDAVRRLARVGEVSMDGEATDAVGAHAVLADGTELFLPLEGVVDLDQERERLRKEIQRLDGQLRASRGRLSNDQFVRKAPEEVVEREREKARSVEEQMGKLEEKLGALGGR